MKRTVFFVSDGTGITAETLGRSLLTQFDDIQFEEIAIPYVDTDLKAKQAIQQINDNAKQQSVKPLIFATVVDPKMRALFNQCEGIVIDFFDTFMGQLETSLNTKATASVGKSHGLKDEDVYTARIDAVNFTISHDDGTNVHNYDKADVVLIGVSRSAKTPTSLYLALQFGIFAANYPFTEDDFAKANIPGFIKAVQPKLFGLTIDAYRLHTIREIRRPNSEYASLPQCQKEVTQMENLYRIENIPYISSTSRSIEEIATSILKAKNLKRRLF